MNTVSAETPELKAYLQTRQNAVKADRLERETCYHEGFLSGQCVGTHPGLTRLENDVIRFQKNLVDDTIDPMDPVVVDVRWGCTMTEPLLPVFKENSIWLLRALVIACLREMPTEDIMIVVDENYHTRVEEYAGKLIGFITTCTDFHLVHSGRGTMYHISNENERQCRIDIVMDNFIPRGTNGTILITPTQLREDAFYKGIVPVMALSQFKRWFALGDAKIENHLIEKMKKLIN